MALTRRCQEQGIHLIQVDPSYTSFIGLARYGALTPSLHESASYVIARRGQCETLSQADRDFRHFTFHLPLYGRQNQLLGVFTRPVSSSPADDAVARIYGQWKAWKRAQHRTLKTATKHWRACKKPAIRFQPFEDIPDWDIPSLSGCNTLTPEPVVCA